jgi:hypothetical protein
MQRMALAREQELRRETLTKEMEWKRLRQDYQTQISELRLMLDKTKEERDGLRLKSSKSKKTGVKVTFFFFFKSNKNGKNTVPPVFCTLKTPKIFKGESGTKKQGGIYVRRVVGIRVSV